MTGIGGQGLLQAARKAGPLGWIAGAAFLWVIVYLIPSDKTQRAEDVLRTTFRLPDAARIEDIRRPQDYRDGSLVEGMVQFSAENYARYRATALDPNLWTPRTLGRNGTAVANTGDATLQSWHPIDTANPQRDPVFARSLYLAELGRLQAIEGLVLCFIVDRTNPAATGTASTLPADDLAVRPCTAVPDGGGSHALFLGVLDDRTQRLSMKVRHRGLLADPS